MSRRDTPTLVDWDRTALNWGHICRQVQPCQCLRGGVCGCTRAEIVRKRRGNQVYLASLSDLDMPGESRGTAPLFLASGDAMVHQHRLWNSILLEGVGQPLYYKHRPGVIQGMQLHGEATMVIQDTQWVTVALLNPKLALEIHLPQLVGPLALKALRRRPMPSRANNTWSFLPPHPYNDSLLYLAKSTIGTVTWPTRAFLQLSHAANLSIPFQPLVTGLATDPELLTESDHILLTQKGPNDKTDSLFQDISPPLIRARVYLEL